MDDSENPTVEQPKKITAETLLVTPPPAPLPSFTGSEKRNLHFQGAVMLVGAIISVLIGGIMIGNVPLLFVLDREQEPDVQLAIDWLLNNRQYWMIGSGLVMLLPAIFLFLALPALYDVFQDVTQTGALLMSGAALLAILCMLGGWFLSTTVVSYYITVFEDPLPDIFAVLLLIAGSLYFAGLALIGGGTVLPVSIIALIHRDRVTPFPRKLWWVGAGNGVVLWGAWLLLNDDPRIAYVFMMDAMMVLFVGAMLLTWTELVFDRSEK